MCKLGEHAWRSGYRAWMYGCRACSARCVGVVPAGVCVCVYVSVRIMRLYERVRACMRARACGYVGMWVCACVLVRVCARVVCGRCERACKLGVHAWRLGYRARRSGCCACSARCVGVVPAGVRECVYVGVRIMRLYARACACMRARASALLGMWVCAHARVCLCACARVLCVGRVCERAEADRLARGPWPPKGHPPDVSVVGTANSSRRYAVRMFVVRSGFRSDCVHESR